MRRRMHRWESAVRTGYLFTLLVSLGIGTQPVRAGTRTWGGGSSFVPPNWSRPQNWSDDAVPGPEDIAVFGSTQTASCIIDTDVSVDGLWVQSGYSGIVSQQWDKSVTVGSSGFILANPGTTNFISGVAPIAVSGAVTVAAGAYLRCQGFTNVINEPSGGTSNSPHGAGATIYCQEAVILGTITADAAGFHPPGPNQASGPAFGGHEEGGGHGGRGASRDPGSSVLFFVNRLAGYGSVTNPTALGSSGRGTAGGGAIRIDTGSGPLTLNGAITARGGDILRGPGAGGSIWISCGILTGSGHLNARGGNAGDRGGGGGGRIAIHCTTSTFTGTIEVGGGTGWLRGQPGSLWYPQWCAALTGGTPTAPLSVTITNSLQYYFPEGVGPSYWNLTVSNAWFETHWADLTIRNLVVTNGVYRFDRMAYGNPWANDMVRLSITNSITVGGTAFGGAQLALSAQRYDLAGDLVVGPGSYLYPLGDTNEVNEVSGGTLTNRHGIGPAIFCNNAIVNGHIKADGLGFPPASGPGGYGAGSFQSASHGGRGGTLLRPAYGSVTNPTALGSGGNGTYGGGAIRIAARGQMVFNGRVTANGFAFESGSTTGGSAGGSLWLTADTLSGTGVVEAAGTSQQMSGASGGRVAMDWNTGGFSGTVTVAGGSPTAVVVDPGRRWSRGQPGTFWCPRWFNTLRGTPEAPALVRIAHSYAYHFADPTNTYYWDLRISNAWFEVHTGTLVLTNLTLETNAVFRFDDFARGQQGVSDMVTLQFANDVRVQGDACWLMLAAGEYEMNDLIVGPYTNTCVFILADTNAVNEPSGGVETNRHGAGVTIRCRSAAIDGIISGREDGFPPLGGPGAAYTSGGNMACGATHAGKGQGNPRPPYGRIVFPTSLGSGASRAGGSALTLIARDAVRVDGEINFEPVLAAVGSTDRSGAGGSVVIAARELTGAGRITVKGGDGRAGGGGGGRLSLEFTTNTFTGTISFAGGVKTDPGTAPGQTGTLFVCQSVAPGASTVGALGLTLDSVFGVSGGIDPGIRVDRTISAWGRSLCEWTDVCRNGLLNPLTNTVQYTLRGLAPNTKYQIWGNGSEIPQSPTNSGPSGQVSFPAFLSGPSNFRVERVSSGTFFILY